MKRVSAKKAPVIRMARVCRSWKIVKRVTMGGGTKTEVWDSSSRVSVAVVEGRGFESGAFCAIDRLSD